MSFRFGVTIVPEIFSVEQSVFLTDEFSGMDVGV
jgi:hypothetical protein